MNLENEQYKHTASLVGNNELQTLVESDPYQTVRNMANQLGIHYLTSSCHLHALDQVQG